MTESAACCSVGSQVNFEDNVVDREFASSRLPSYKGYYLQIYSYEASLLGTNLYFHIFSDAIHEYIETGTMTDPPNDFVSVNIGTQVDFVSQISELQCSLNVKC